MEEGEYKSTYSELASVRCIFEKALTNHQAKCSLSNHFCLADREGYACDDKKSSVKCGEFLVKLREKSIFVLKLHDADGPLSHNKEIRVQVGGVTGVAKSMAMLDEGQSDRLIVSDINGVLSKAIEQYGSLENLPYSDIIQSVKQFQGRPRRQRKS